MKNLLLLFLVIFFIPSCSNDSSKQARDIDYNIDGVRVVLPREFQKVSSEAEIKEKIFHGNDSLSFVNQLLYNNLVKLNTNQPNWFIKFEDDNLEFITLKTDGPPLPLKEEITSYLLQQFEGRLSDYYAATDSTYRFKLIQEKLTGANSVKYFKFKYAHHVNGIDWYSTNYMIYANSRTIGLSIQSPNQNYVDLENYMQFIKIEK